MAVAVNHNCFLVSVMVLLPAFCVSLDTFTSSRATYYGSPDCLGTASGACGYGEYGRTVNNGYVTGVSKLYRNGTGCGACYQVRCKVPKLCTDYGVNVVVTDYGEGDRTDFILSASAYTKMAQPNLALELVAYGTVDVEYGRISCQYPNTNLMFKVHENSRFPVYLALVVLYQAGQTEITAVELWQEDCQQWRGTRRAYGAVWDMSNPPRGSLDLRFQATSTNGEWVLLKGVIPSDWKAGVAYDSAFQLS
ncbi:Expansin, cellulose-binding-like domain [Dillenia turbinata]|uniref:Expansin, cellulose-binding-like domain n=1 Tax=Dillenia turbinata TaxID=194707 RepID=A0AAN8VSU1_9MAGN